MASRCLACLVSESPTSASSIRATMPRQPDVSRSSSDHPAACRGHAGCQGLRKCPWGPPRDHPCCYRYLGALEGVARHVGEELEALEEQLLQR